ncbi:S16 family serine protease [Bifidobacterium subtile]|nr:S16 family serine protease [Bifidobacterium subtile]QOL35712.1 Lon protease [Bifidobacterium subtile]
MSVMHANEEQPQSHGARPSPRPQDSDKGRTGLFSRTVDAVRSYFASRSLRYLAGLICLALCIIVLALPSPYVVESPGPTRDVLESSEGKRIITVSGASGDSDTAGSGHRDAGKLLLVTVNAMGIPGYPVSNAQALWAWLDAREEVTPSEAVFPVGQNADQYEKHVQGEMTGSQDAAKAAALGYARRLGVDVSGVKVSMHVDDIGGPSAGMMYSLGLIDKLTAAQETGGKTIAGTGTIDAKGEVGAIGGIRLKMIGAKRDGATWFLAPKSNCGEVVRHVPEGLRDVQVSTLDEAYKAVVAIGQGKGDALPHCVAGGRR